MFGFKLKNGEQQISGNVREFAKFVTRNFDKKSLRVWYDDIEIGFMDFNNKSHEISKIKPLGMGQRTVWVYKFGDRAFMHLNKKEIELIKDVIDDVGTKLNAMEKEEKEKEREEIRNQAFYSLYRGVE